MQGILREGEKNLIHRESKLALSLKQTFFVAK